MEDNLKRLINETCGEALKHIETRARELLKEIDDSKPKLKIFMSGKQKQQSAKNDALCQECKLSLHDHHHSLFSSASLLLIFSESTSTSPIH